MPSVAGVWVGAAVDSEAEVVRLELDDQGKGLLIISEAAGSSRDAFYVRATHLKGDDITFTLEPAGPAEPVSVRGRLTFDITITEEGGEWSRTFHLRKSKWLTARLNDVDRWAREIHQKGPAVLQSK